jgi:predicted ATP-grasp superfamily ATP-dependent carboligase
MTSITPAVVLGAGINGLGVARSLAGVHVPVWLLDCDPRRAELRTRAAKPLIIATLSGDALIDELVRVGSSQFAGQRPVLFLTQEESVRAVSRQRDRLTDLYRFTLPAADVVDALQHKHGFQLLAEQYDAPIPRLVRVRAPTDLAALAGLRYPVAVKPAAHNAAYSSAFKKAYRVENVAQCQDLVRHILAVLPDVVVQEWIEGPDANIHFCLQYIGRDGQVAASFTGRKIRSWPPHVGGTASCLPAPKVDAELAALTTGFFQNTGVIGMASMEYKRDANTGAFRMVEPTIGRTDYQEEVATLNGVNLPCAAYCAELNLPLPTPAPLARGVAWRVRSEDVQSAAAQRQSSRSGFESVDLVADALWRSADPAPWLAQGLRIVRDAVRRRAAHMRPGAPATGSGT